MLNKTQTKNQRTLTHGPRIHLLPIWKSLQPVFLSTPPFFLLFRLLMSVQFDYIQKMLLCWHQKISWPFPSRKQRPPAIFTNTNQYVLFWSRITTLTTFWYDIISCHVQRVRKMNRSVHFRGFSLQDWIYRQISLNIKPPTIHTTYILNIPSG